MEQKPIKIVIIGKDWESGRELRSFLKSKRVKVYSFVKAVAAMIYLDRRGSADILITEFDTSILSGVGVIRVTRKWLPKMVKICLSENPNDENIAIQEGFDLFIRNPFNGELLWNEALTLYKWKKDAVLE